MTREGKAALALALGAGLATGVRLFLFGDLGAHGPFLSYVPVVTVAAWLGGIRSGLFATALCLGLAWVPLPPGPFLPLSPLEQDEIRALLFLASGVCISLVSHQMHTALLAAGAHASRLKEQDRRKDEFVAMLAHELRNPLGVICNAAQIIQLRDAHDAIVQRARSAIQRQSRHMIRLVDDLMDASRLSRGEITLRLASVSLREVLVQALETVRPQMDAHRHEVRVTLPDDTLPLQGDETRLVQVFMNLLNNAAKYTPEGGVIAVTACRENGDAVACVRDNGRGIPALLLPHVFDLFVQGEQGRDRQEGGLGVGLALVKRMVEAHQGTVVAHSPGKGSGSEFVVRLPVQALEVPPAPPPPCAVLAARGKATVLVVEDNLDAGTTMVEVLELMGHQAALAVDGPSALTWLSANPLPHVVLLDIGLPGMDGYALAGEIRARYGLRPLLVALTGYGQDSDRVKSKQAGCDLHLTKPVNVAELERVLSSVGTKA